jgi:hypothetical protein
MSFIHLPTLFGSQYLLPGILIVVLLLVLLLLFSSRRRAKAERASLAPAQEAESPAPDQPDELQPATAPTMSVHAPMPAVVTQPVAVFTQPVGMAGVQSAMAQPQPTMMAPQPSTMTPQPVPVQTMGYLAPQAAMSPQPAAVPPFNIVAPPAAAAAAAAAAPAYAPVQAPAQQYQPLQAVPPMQPTAPVQQTQPLPQDQPMPQDQSMPDQTMPDEPMPYQTIPDQTVEPSPFDGFDQAEVKSRRSGRRGRAGRQPAVPAFAAPPATSGEDPLYAAVMDVLNGWGEITPEDTKRLELFRADRLSATLATLQLPKSKSNDAKVRLTQLRTFAAGLERRQRDNEIAAANAAAAGVAAPAAAPIAAAASASVAAPLAGASAIAARPATLPGTPAPMSAPAAAPTPIGAMPMGQAQTAAAATPAPATTPASPSRSFYDLDPVLPAPSATSPTASDINDTATHDLRSVVDQPMVDKPATKPNDPNALWAEPRPLWEPDPEPTFEESAEPRYHELDVDPTATSDPFDMDFKETGNGNGNGNGNGHGNDCGNAFKPEMTLGVPLDTSALSAALNTPLMGMPAAPPQPMAQPTPLAPAAPPAAGAKPPFAVDDSFWDDEPDMSRLSVKVETAEQLLALPADERADMTAFLAPTELAATFRGAQDPELKRAVIDTLEHIGTPASLNALGTCFEDADPDIQVYALTAADRLLGVVQ